MTRRTRPYNIHTYNAHSCGGGGLNVGAGAVDSPHPGHNGRSQTDKIFMNFNFAV